MSTGVPGARWRQLRSRTLSTPEGEQNYQEGYQQAQTYRDTMRLLNTIRAALGISQTELAQRLEKSQPTVTRLLTHGENPTLATLDQILRGLGVRGRLVIETENIDASGIGLVVEAKGMPLESYHSQPKRPHKISST